MEDDKAEDNIETLIYINLDAARLWNKIDEDKGNERTEAYNTGAEGNYVEVSTDKGVELMTPEEAEEYRKKKAAHKKQASDKKQAEK